MDERFDIEGIRASLRRIMKAKDIKPTTLSLLIGPSKTSVKELLEKNEDVKVSTLVRLAGALDVELEEMLGRQRVSIAGYIGAGGQVIFEDIGEEVDPDSTVIRPPGITGKLIALVVRGNSMFPKYKDGDILYIQRNHDGLMREYIGEDCAVRLTSGETYIKQIAFGSKPERYTLVSLNAPEITDVEIEWATPIIFIMPKRARLMTS